MYKPHRYVTLRKGTTRIRDSVRRIRLAVGYRLLDKKKAAAHMPPLDQIKKILFMRHDGKIGDYIVSTLMYRNIKHYAPHIQLDVVASPETLALFQENPYIDNCYLPKKRSFWTFAMLGWQLKHQHYDIVVDATEPLRNRDVILIRNIHAPINIGIVERLSLINCKLSPALRHITAVHQDTLIKLGVPTTDPYYDIPCYAPSAQAVSNFLTQHMLQNYIVLNSFGASTRRQFSSQSIKKLITKLNQHYPDTPILLLTYPAVTEKLQALIKEMNNDKLFIYAQTNTILDTIELIRYAALVVSPDTSIVHIAVGLNKSLLAFYLDNEDIFTGWQPNSQAPTQIIRYHGVLNDYNLDDLVITLTLSTSCA